MDKFLREEEDFSHRKQDVEGINDEGICGHQKFCFSGLIFSLRNYLWHFYEFFLLLCFRD